MKIMVVDDSSTMRRIIKNALLKIGINKNDIIEAADGKEALDKYLRNHSDISVILTDWNMPEMSGLDFVKAVRKFEKENSLNKTKIVMITTEGGKKEVITALKAGVNNYIVKPFSLPTLKKKLEQIGINVS